jgi:hypothetical protein
MMEGEISFDLVMNDNMPFVEGTFRLPGQEWQVFIFGPDTTVVAPEVNPRARWESGVTGVFVKWPESLRLHKAVILQILSEHLGITKWNEVHGPDSMGLR